MSELTDLEKRVATLELLLGGFLRGLSSEEKTKELIKHLRADPDSHLYSILLDALETEPKA